MAPKPKPRNPTWTKSKAILRKVNSKLTMTPRKEVSKGIMAKETTVHDLNEYVLQTIFGYLKNVDDLEESRAVCRRWRQTATPLFLKKLENEYGLVLPSILPTFENFDEQETETEIEKEPKMSTQTNSKPGINSTSLKAKTIPIETTPTTSMPKASVKPKLKTRLLNKFTPKLKTAPLEVSPSMFSPKYYKMLNKPVSTPTPIFPGFKLTAKRPRGKKLTHKQKPKAIEIGTDPEQALIFLTQLKEIISAQKSHYQ